MDYKEKVDRYLDNLESEGIEKKNANLIREFVKQSRARVSQPCNRTLYDLAGRMKTIVRLLNNRPLDKLTEEDIQDLNRAMSEKDFKYPSDYRRVLKTFFRLKDKKKYRDLMESEFLSERGRKNDKVLVDPDRFFSQQECEAYLRESIRTSKRQQCFASMWLTFGLRPTEYLELTKRMVLFRDKGVAIRVPKVKTPKRLVFVNSNQGQMIKDNVLPWLNELEDDDYIFHTKKKLANGEVVKEKLTWFALNKMHKRICAKAGISKKKDWKLYMARKMCLTKFYTTYKVGKASQMAGHVPGSKAMKHYVALNENQLMEEEEVVAIGNKFCPRCNTENSAIETICIKCNVPLDSKVYNQILKEAEIKQSIRMREMEERMKVLEKMLAR